MKIIIVGKSGCGKDYFKQYLTKRGLLPDVSFTTRHKKEHEKDGIDYHFISKDVFDGCIERQQMIQWQEFNGNKYGTHAGSWNTCDVFIMNVNGLKQLNPEYRTRALVYYLDIDQHTRFVRILKRDYNLELEEYNKESNEHGAIEHTINTRMLNDEREYTDFTDFDIRITNPDFINQI